MTNAENTVAVIGAGTMGAGIAQVALEAGWSVRLHDAFPGATDRGRDRILDGLRRRSTRAGHEPAWIHERMAGLSIVGSPADAAAGATIVIEAIVEDLAAKQALLADLDAAAPPATMLATNTSALSVSAIASGAALHPERVVGLHFFNPAPVLTLVEIVAGVATDPGVLDRVTAIITSWGRTPVRSADSPGFIVNRVNRPFTIEALRMVEAGEARVVDIDAAVRADRFPLGPFELMDLVGLDVNLAAARGVWEGLLRPDRLRPSEIQEWLVGEGRLGRKSGIGFYRHEGGDAAVPDPLPVRLAPRVPDGKDLPPGEIVHRIRSAVAAEAVLTRDEGVASEADIDTAISLGAAHPEGPFAWLRRHDPTIEP